MSTRVVGHGDNAPPSDLLWHRLPQRGATVTETRSDDEVNERIQTLLAQERDRAFQEGLASGYQKAHAELAAEQENQRQKLHIALDSLKSYRPQLRRQAERDTVELALAIAKRLIHRQIEADPSVLVGLVKAAVDDIDAHDKLTLRVAPEWHGLFLGLDIPVQADDSLEGQTLILESANAYWDAGVDSQLDEIRRGLADRLDRS